MKINFFIISKEENTFFEEDSKSLYEMGLDFLYKYLGKTRVLQISFLDEAWLNFSMTTCEKF